MINNIKLTEKELLMDLLMSEKLVASSYNNGVMEATCPKLRDILLECLDNIQDCQYEIFKALTQRGWYSIKEADISEIEYAKNKYNRILDNLT